MDNGSRGTPFGFARSSGADGSDKTTGNRGFTHSFGGRGSSIPVRRTFGFSMGRTSFGRSFGNIAQGSLDEDSSFDSSINSGTGSGASTEHLGGNSTGSETAGDSGGSVVKEEPNKKPVDEPHKAPITNLPGGSDGWPEYIIRAANKGVSKPAIVTPTKNSAGATDKGEQSNIKPGFGPAGKVLGKLSSLHQVQGSDAVNGHEGSEKDEGKSISAMTTEVEKKSAMNSGHGAGQNDVSPSKVSSIWGVSDETSSGQSANFGRSKGFADGRDTDTFGGPGFAGERGKGFAEKEGSVGRGTFGGPSFAVGRGAFGGPGFVGGRGTGLTEKEGTVGRGTFGGPSFADGRGTIPGFAGGGGAGVAEKEGTAGRGTFSGRGFAGGSGTFGGPGFAGGRGTGVAEKESTAGRGTFSGRGFSGGSGTFGGPGFAGGRGAGVTEKEGTAGRGTFSGRGFAGGSGTFGGPGFAGGRGTGVTEKEGTAGRGTFSGRGFAGGSGTFGGPGFAGGHGTGVAEKESTAGRGAFGGSGLAGGRGTFGGPGYGNGGGKESSLGENGGKDERDALGGSGFAGGRGTESSFGKSGFAAGGAKSDGMRNSVGGPGFSMEGTFGGEPQNDDRNDKREKSAFECFNCGKSGHISRDCTEPRKPRVPKYYNCGKEGHKSAECGQHGKQFSGGERPGVELKKEDDLGVQNLRLGTEDDGHGAEDNGQKKGRLTTYVPPEITAEEILKEYSVSAGTHFNEFYSTKVNVSCEGKVVHHGSFKSFNVIGLPGGVVRNVLRAGYKKPTPVQEYAIPIMMEGKDLMCCAPTGCGKTAAFLLPLLAKFLAEDDLSTVTETVPSPRCIVIAPTHELADQIVKEAKKFCDGTKCLVAPLYGGTHVEYQKNSLKGATFIVCTVGRLMYFVSDGLISLEKLRAVVIDEADRMLALGAEDQMANFANILHLNVQGMPNACVQIVMFSATFPTEVQVLAGNFMKPDYYMVAVGIIGSANSCIAQRFVLVNGPTEKKDALLNLLKIDLDRYTIKEKDVEELNRKKTLVFVNRKRSADILGSILSQAGLMATTIHGDRDQRQREEALRDFRLGRMPVLLATAVAERGLDIRNVDHVINYDLPLTRQEYVHRIGRTGRVGNDGTATSFYEPKIDSPLAADLVAVLQEVQQEPPDFILRDAGYGATCSGVPVPAIDSVDDDGEW